MNRRHTRLIAAVAMASLTVTIVFWSATTEESTSAFSPDGEGAAPLVQDANDQGIEAFRLLSGPLALATDPTQDPEHTLLVVIGPERPYQQDEVEAVQEFLHLGGRVLVADGFGQGNTLTSPLGLTFERVRLVQPEGQEDTLASVEGRELNLRLNNPTAIRIDKGIDHQILASSPAGSFLDRDGDGTIGSADPVGTFPVAVALDIGARGGRLVAIADPAPFLASTGYAADNPGLRLALLDLLLADGGRIVIDESRSVTSDPWLLSVTTWTSAILNQPSQTVILVLTGLVALIGIGLMTSAKWAPHRFVPDRFIRRADIEQTAEGSGKAGPSDEKGTARTHGGEGSHWTTHGRVAMFGGLGLAIFGSMAGNLQATTAGALLLLSCVLALWTRAARIRGHRHIPVSRTPEDSAVQVTLELAAIGRGRRSVEIQDTLPKEFDVRKGHTWFQTDISPGTPLTISYEARPAVRGPYLVGPLQARRSDPFGLRHVQVDAYAAQELLVNPRHDPLSRIPFQSKVAAPTLGPHLVNRAGDGSEFHALRDYLEGDSIRSINWKASARASKFIVNQRVHESMSTITIFIDARAISAAGPVRSSPLNESCRAALSIATGALQARDRVQVFTYGDGVKDIAPGKGSEQMHHLTKALAELEGTGTTTFKEAVDAVLPTLPSRKPVILLSGFEGDDTITAGLKALHKRNIVPTVFAMPLGIRPSSDAEDGDPEPGAERLQEEQEKTIAAIRGMSVQAVPVVPKASLSHTLRVGVA